jgi:hypothetical protein
MESLKMPLRQILKTYTKSELSIIAWRSAETAHNMNEMQQDRPVMAPAKIETPVSELELERKLGPAIVDKFGGIDGEVDLRKLTGDEAIRYMRVMGEALGETGSIN